MGAAEMMGVSRVCAAKRVNGFNRRHRAEATVDTNLPQRLSQSHSQGSSVAELRGCKSALRRAGAGAATL